LDEIGEMPAVMQAKLLAVEAKIIPRSYVQSSMGYDPEETDAEILRADARRQEMTDFTPSAGNGSPAQPAEGLSPKVVEMQALAQAGKFEDLVGALEPKEAQRLGEQDKAALAEVYRVAADRMLFKNKDVAFASLLCERGLGVQPEHAELLRLQIEIYLHPDMNLVDGAEELAERLTKLDGENQRNQLLRGKVAFEQGEYEVAVTWLTKAARSGREQHGKHITEAWKLLDLAKGKVEETRSALSMTRELEGRLHKAKIVAQSHAADKAPEPAIGEPMRPDDGGAPAAEGGGGPVVLYMTKWCKYCKKTAELLKSLDVKFEQKDIERDQQALVEMMELAQRAGVEVTGVPVLRVGARLVVGYNQELIERLVKK
ncbi:MAG TPA: glutaredoxin domain-containing protein, partial [Myxococcota bacterium]|nr:glutaredoxin domain-containing protein [Myxococcota bacterium]